MTNYEITLFIDEMRSRGDFWTVNQVENIYGKMSLEDALHERISIINTFGTIITRLIKESNRASDLG